MGENRFPLFINFTAGELSPTLDGRIDIPQYNSGVKELENFLPVLHGPVSRRPGSRFVSEAKFSDRATRVVSFEFSTVQTYILEFGDQYVRFYRDGGRIEEPLGSAVEIATPYLEADLFDLKFAQSADVLYIAHPSYATRTISRTSHTNWNIEVVSFNPPPTFEEGNFPATTLTPGATTGLGITFTAGAAEFIGADVNRAIIFGNSKAVIRSLVLPEPSTQVVVDIIDDFPDTNPIPSGDWSLAGSPATSCTPDISGPVNAIANLATVPNAFRADIVGKYVRINGGVIRVTVFNSAKSVDGIILSELSSTSAAVAGAWSVEVEEWSVTRGFPTAITFHEQRLWLAGSTTKPQTLWGSASGDFNNFSLGPDDDDAVEYTIASTQVDAIKWIVSHRTLLIGTVGSEFNARGQNGPLTPSNVTMSPETHYGSSGALPLRIGNATIFITRSGRELREMAYQFESDAYAAADILLLSSHLTEAGTMVEMDYRADPFPILGIIRSDGTLMTATYERQQRVVGWARQVTQGNYESIAAIPGEVWVVVQRTIDGVPKKYLERFGGAGTAGHYGSLFQDSALTYDGVATTSFSGLQHLAGETISVLGEGSVYPDTVVQAGGTFEIDGPAVTQAEFGLPYTSTLTTMRPETPLALGTSQGRKKHWNRVQVRLNNSLGFEFETPEGSEKHRMPFRKAGDLMGDPPPLFTGDKRAPNLGYDREGRIKIIQTQPLPITVVGIYGELAVSG